MGNLGLRFPKLPAGSLTRYRMPRKVQALADFRLQAPFLNLPACPNHKFKDPESAKPRLRLRDNISVYPISSGVDPCGCCLPGAWMGHGNKQVQGAAAAAKAGTGGSSGGDHPRLVEMGVDAHQRMEPGPRRMDQWHSTRARGKSMGTWWAGGRAGGQSKF